MSTSSDDELVGYGHPPRRTRWRKGQSGNPNRKYSKRTYGTVEIIDNLFQMLIDVTVNGETKKVTTLEAIMMQLSSKEIAGNHRASRVRMKYQEFAIQNSERRTEITFVDNPYTCALAAVPSTSGGDHG